MSNVLHDPSIEVQSYWETEGDLVFVSDEVYDGSQSARFRTTLGGPIADEPLLRQRFQKPVEAGQAIVRGWFKREQDPGITMNDIEIRVGANVVATVTPAMVPEGGWVFQQFGPFAVDGEQEISWEQIATGGGGDTGTWWLDLVALDVTPTLSTTELIQLAVMADIGEIDGSVPWRTAVNQVVPYPIYPSKIPKADHIAVQIFEGQMEAALETVNNQIGEAVQSYMIRVDLRADQIYTVAPRIQDDIRNALERTDSNTRKIEHAGANVRRPVRWVTVQRSPGVLRAEGDIQNKHGVIEPIQVDVAYVYRRGGL